MIKYLLISHDSNGSLYGPEVFDDFERACTELGVQAMELADGMEEAYVEINTGYAQLDSDLSGYARIWEVKKLNTDTWECEPCH